MDSYYPVSPEALNLIIAYKNIISFGFSYAIVPWLGKWGFERVFGTMAGLYLLFAVVFAIPLYYFGKTFREVIAKWKIILW